MWCWIWRHHWNVFAGSWWWSFCVRSMSGGVCCLESTAWKHFICCNWGGTHLVLLCSPQWSHKKPSCLQNTQISTSSSEEVECQRGVVCVAIWIEQQFETQVANVGYQIKSQNDWRKVATRDDRILTYMNSRCVGQTERKCWRHWHVSSIECFLQCLIIVKHCKLPASRKRNAFTRIATPRALAHIQLECNSHRFALVDHARSWQQTIGGTQTQPAQDNEIRTSPFFLRYQQWVCGIWRPQCSSSITPWVLTLRLVIFSVDHSIECSWLLGQLRRVHCWACSCARKMPAASRAKIDTGLRRS